jgi:copper chaperone CopZ
MKNNIKSIALLSILFVALSSFVSKSEKIIIKTSGTCDMCKEKIEKTLNDVPGVEKAYYNLANGAVTVKFEADKTNADALRLSISAVGYDADGVKANQSAHDALPKCCQKGQECKH